MMLYAVGRLVGRRRWIAATWYIASRTGDIANVEPIDFILFLAFRYRVCCSYISFCHCDDHGVMKPTVTGTREMVTDSDAIVAQLLKMKEEAIKKTAYWQMYVGPSARVIVTNGTNTLTATKVKAG
jgi:hypothetical protein